MVAENRQLVKHEERPSDLTQYDRSKYNVLAPISIMRDDIPYVRQRVAVVQLDPDPDKGDCYAAPGTSWSGPQGQKKPDKVAPAKAGLMKLAAAMGIVWKVDSVPPKSHRLAREMAAGLDSKALKTLFDEVRYDCAYRAVVAVRDGLDWRYIEATYEWELDAQTRKIRREARKPNTAKRIADQGQTEEQYVADRVDQIISERFGLAESKAILRAIRATGIRHQYLREEFGKPFVTQRTEFAPDMDDPAMQAAVREKALTSGAELFGGDRSETPSRAVTASADPDFAAAERDGRFEHTPPIDVDADEVIDADAAGAGPKPADADDDDMPGPWDDETKPANGDHGAPSRKELFATATTLWNDCTALKAAGKLATMPTSPKDLETSKLADWVIGTTELVATAKGGGA
jgi:hypothetical protein